MTKQELIENYTLEELADMVLALESRNSGYEKGLEVYIKQASELMDKNVELESELSVKENLLKIKNGLCADNNELPVDPIEVAQMLINATFEYEASSLDKALFKCGNTRTAERYSVDDLEQIAEHLMVYCRHNRESE